MDTPKYLTFAAILDKIRIPLSRLGSKIPKFMEKVLHKLFLFSTGAIFFRDSDRYIDGELREFYESLKRSQDQLSGCAEDRENMHSDVQNLRKSFKKSVKEAMEEFSS